MTETDALKAAAVRALESHANGPWTAADTDWVDDRVRHALGESSDPESALGQRHAFVLRRLGEKAPAWRRWLERQGQSRERGAWPRRLAVFGVTGALALGLAADAIGSSGRIALLAPPLFALLAWNAMVYAAALGAAVARWARRLKRPAGVSPRSWPVPDQATAGAGVADALVRAAWLTGPAAFERIHDLIAGRTAPQTPTHEIPRAARVGLAAAQRATAARWLWPVWQARALAWMHAAAAALAIGAVAGMYVRGFGFEYRAVWDSTFLDATAAHALLATVLGPASALTGIPVPQGEAFAALRGSVGPGDNAAPWIHLWGVTLAGAVVVPRAVLALMAGSRARRLSRTVPLPWNEDPWLDGLRRRSSGEMLRLWLVPHRWAPAPEALQRLREQARGMLGRPARIDMAATVREGDEAEGDPAHPVVPGGGRPCAWVRLAATPEREPHGRLLQGLGLRGDGPPGLLVDESGFAHRFAPAEAARRRHERREAWRDLARQLGVDIAFADSSTPTGPHASVAPGAAPPPWAQALLRPTAAA